MVDVAYSSQRVGPLASRLLHTLAPPMRWLRFAGLRRRNASLLPIRARSPTPPGIHRDNILVRMGWRERKVEGVPAGEDVGAGDLTVRGFGPLPVVAGMLVGRVVEAPEPAPDRPFVLPFRAVTAVTPNFCLGLPISDDR